MVLVGTHGYWWVLTGYWWVLTGYWWVLTGYWWVLTGYWWVLTGYWWVLPVCTVTFRSTTATHTQKRTLTHAHTRTDVQEEESAARSGLDAALKHERAAKARFSRYS